MAIDGKFLKGTVADDKKGLHLLAAYLPDEGIVIKKLHIGPDGRIKGAQCDITLQELDKPLALAPNDATAPLPSTRYKPMLLGDTYEAMAQREYGSAILGVFMRQDATTAFPAAGDIVSMVPATRYTRRKIIPLAHSLGDSDAAVAARLALFDDHSAPVTMPRSRGDGR